MKYLFQYLAFSVVGLFLFACGSYPVKNSKESKEKPVIIKGCGDKRIPKDAYVIATQYLKPTAKKISYGEACSAVPLK